MHFKAFLLILFIPLVAPAQSAQWQIRSEEARRLDIGESAPDWLMDSETYAIGYNPNDWASLAQSKIAFITHCPTNPEFFARCHALGIRCFPYVTFYQGFANTTYMGVNLKDHPDYIEIDPDSNLKRTGFWESEDSKNMYTTCPNVAAYQDAMVAWVTKLMEMGADGIFVDNLGARVPCFGPKYHKHEHLYDDQTHAFAMLLKRAREVVKHYKPDGAVLGNSAYPPTLPHEYWSYLDAEMLESYICTWVSADRWFDWATHWDQAGKDLQPFVRAGKQIQALSYLGHTPYGVREDGFFCYATARLAGFVWSGGQGLSDPDTSTLYRTRLGEAQSEELVENGVHYRLFRAGFVALNPDKDKAATISLAAMPSRLLFDLFGNGAANWQPFTLPYALDTKAPHGGARSALCVNSVANQERGALQTLTVNQTAPGPITVSGWSRAENVSGAADGNYSIYCDVQYTDGTWLYGQVAAFTVGTHDWERQTVTIHPEKPVARINAIALFRNKTGSVWFDDISARTEDGAELVFNNGFELPDREGRQIDCSATNTVEIPPYSGRAYLYMAGSSDATATHGPRLTVKTSPAIGEVRFRVDGFDYWTHSGHWTTQYVMGADFGAFDILFDTPGTHTVEIVDVVPGDMKTPAGYGSGERLGQFMDPSNPTKPSDGKKFKFHSWEAKGEAAGITVDVNTDTTVTATFDSAQNQP